MCCPSCMQMNGEKLEIWLEIDLGNAPMAMNSLDQLMLVVTHPGLAAVISIKVDVFWQPTLHLNIRLRQSERLLTTMN